MEYFRLHSVSGVEDLWKQLTTDPVINQIGKQYIETIRSQLGPDDAGHTKEPIQEQEDGNVQAKLADSGKLEYGCPLSAPTDETGIVVFSFSFVLDNKSMMAF